MEGPQTLALEMVEKIMNNISCKLTPEQKKEFIRGIYNIIYSFTKTHGLHEFFSAESIMAPMNITAQKSRLQPLPQSLFTRKSETAEGKLQQSSSTVSSTSSSTSSTNSSDVSSSTSSGVSSSTSSDVSSSTSSIISPSTTSDASSDALDDNFTRSSDDNYIAKLIDWNKRNPNYGKLSFEQQKFLEDLLYTLAYANLGDDQISTINQLANNLIYDFYGYKSDVIRKYNNLLSSLSLNLIHIHTTQIGPLLDETLTYHKNIISSECANDINYITHSEIKYLRPNQILAVVERIVNCLIHIREKSIEHIELRNYLIMLSENIKNNKINNRNNNNNSYQSEIKGTHVGAYRTRGTTTRNNLHTYQGSKPSYYARQSPHTRYSNYRRRQSNNYAHYSHDNRDEKQRNYYDHHQY